MELTEMNCTITNFRAGSRNESKHNHQENGQHLEIHLFAFKNECVKLKTRPIGISVRVKVKCVPFSHRLRLFILKMSYKNLTKTKFFFCLQSSLDQRDISIEFHHKRIQVTQLRDKYKCSFSLLKFQSKFSINTSSNAIM